MRNEVIININRRNEKKNKRTNDGDVHILFFFFFLLFCKITFISYIWLILYRNDICVALELNSAPCHYTLRRSNIDYDFVCWPDELMSLYYCDKNGNGNGYDCKLVCTDLCAHLNACAHALVQTSSFASICTDAVMCRLTSSMHTRMLITYQKPASIKRLEYHRHFAWSTATHFYYCYRSAILLWWRLLLLFLLLLLLTEMTISKREIALLSKRKWENETKKVYVGFY